MNLLHQKKSDTVMGRPPALSAERQKYIKDFIERGEIIYVNPGRRDQVWIGRDDEGRETYATRRYLLWTLKETIGLLNMELEEKDEGWIATHGPIQRFFHSHCKFLVFQKNIPDNSCICIYCENLDLILRGAGMADKQTILKSICCDASSEDCLLKHAKCGVESPKFLEIIAKLKSDETLPISGFQWVTDGKYEKKMPFTWTGKEFAAMLTKQFGKYIRHQYSAARQHAELKALKANLKNYQVIIQTDFSENYTNKQQDETQTAYFGHDSFSIYTAVMWFMENGEMRVKSFGFVSDDSSHDRYVAFHANNLLISEARKLIPKLSEVHFWSDGCAQQFRSKYCFAIATRYPRDIKLKWSYFEAHHGKGPVDGIGGCIKATVYRHVRARKVVITTAEGFSKYANDHIEKITVNFISKDDIQKPDINILPIPDLPGTLRVHYFVRSVTSDSMTSVFYANTNATVKVGEIEYDEELMDQLERNGVINPTIPETGSEPMPVQENRLKSVDKACDVASSEFVVCKYGHLWWLGAVQEIDDDKNDVLVSFMAPHAGPNKSNKTLFHWPAKVDRCWLEPESILGALVSEDCPVPAGSRNWSIAPSLVDTVSKLFSGISS